jgi:hypothetical protein
MGGACSTQWDVRNSYKILVGKPEENKPVERPRCRCDLKQDMRAWTGSFWPRIRTSGVLL